MKSLFQDFGCGGGPLTATATPTQRLRQDGPNSLGLDDSPILRGCPPPQSGQRGSDVGSMPKVHLEASPQELGAFPVVRGALLESQSGGRQFRIDPLSGSGLLD
jgi:hypothetical protein